MDAVSIFDHTIVAIREGRLNRDEVAEILRELWAAYPEEFEHVGLDGTLTPDWMDIDESRLERELGELPD